MSYPDPDESENQDIQVKEGEVASQKEQILKRVLHPDARLRINNIKMVKPDLANLVENYVIGMVTQGKLNSQISDDQLKQILLSLQQPKRDFKITRR